MFKKIVLALLLAVVGFPAVAQQFQTSDLPPYTPLYATNALYVNGWSPGYSTTGSSSGITLTLSSGTNLITGVVVNYAGGTLSLTDASTNYIYLDNTGIPGFNTSGFVAGEFPLAVVVTNSGNITSITDVRGFYSAAGSGPCTIYNSNSTICGTGNNATPNTASQEYGFQNNISNTSFGNIRWLVSVGNNNTLNSTGSDVINIGDTTGQADSSSSSDSIIQEDTILMGDNAGQTATKLQDVIALGDFELSGVSGADQIEDVVAIGDQGAEGLNDGTNIMVCIGFAPCQNTGVSGAATESVFIGDSAGQDSVGTENIGLGDGALRNTHGSPQGTIGNANIAVGLYALGADYSGSDNVAIGSNAGCVGCTNNSNGQGNTTGSHNVWIGDTTGQSVPSSTQIDNSIAIGYQAQNSTSNQTVIGNSSTTSLKLFGCVTGGIVLDDGSGTCTSLAWSSLKDSVSNLALNLGTHTTIFTGGLNMLAGTYEQQNTWTVGSVNVPVIYQGFRTVYGFGTLQASFADEFSMAVPSGATQFEADDLTAYATCASTTTDCVALSTTAVREAANTPAFGGNINVWDNNFGGPHLFGLEVDTVAQNSSTSGEAIRFDPWIGSLSQPFYGIHLIQAGNGNVGYTSLIESDNLSAVHFADIGESATVSGVSQDVNWGNGVTSYRMYVDAGGLLNFNGGLKLGTSGQFDVAANGDVTLSGCATDTLVRADGSGCSGPVLKGTTGIIGGSALLVNNCSTGTVTLASVTNAMVISVTPVADPNSTTVQDYTWYGYMSSTNTVTVKVCALVAGTPAATTYNVVAQ